MRVMSFLKARKGQLGPLVPKLRNTLRFCSAIRYGVVSVPSLTSNVVVVQYGQVIGVSIVSGSTDVIVWRLVVPHGELHDGQFTTTVSCSGHTNSMICFS